MLLIVNFKKVMLLLLLCVPVIVSATEHSLLNIQSVAQAINEKYTLKQLQQLPQYEIVTKIPWSNETHRYRGPYLEDVFTFAKVKGDWLTMYALDHYQISFNFQKIKKYKPILALQVDGQLLTIRSKGPVWLILPMSDYKELNAALYHDYMVWQLLRINVEEKQSVD